MAPPPAPPPPPPPPVSSKPGSLRASNQGRRALLDSIQKGTNLKPTKDRNDRSSAFIGKTTSSYTMQKEMQPPLPPPSTVPIPLKGNDSGISTEARDNLLDSIRKGVTLKPTKDRINEGSASIANTNKTKTKHEGKVNCICVSITTATF